MATRDEEVFDAFVRIWSIWWSGAPDSLKRQEPSVVVRLLTLGLREGGISQANLQRELQINQPRLSKLTDKLRKAGWIKVKTSAADRRIRLTATTVKAQERLSALKAELAALVRAPRAEKPPARRRATKSGLRLGKPIRPQGRGFLDEFESQDTNS